MNDCYNWELEEALIDMESNTDFIEKYMSDDIESFGHGRMHGLERDCIKRKCIDSFCRGIRALIYQRFMGQG